MIALRRPILSHSGPLNKLPIGCATCAKLAVKQQIDRLNIIHFKWKSSSDQKYSLNLVFNSLHSQEVSAAEIRRFSPGFKSWHTPINDGITIDGNAPNSPKLKIIKFFAHVARICEYNLIKKLLQTQSNWLDLRQNSSICADNLGFFPIFLHFFDYFTKRTHFFSDTKLQNAIFPATNVPFKRTHSNDVYHKYLPHFNKQSLIFVFAKLVACKFQNDNTHFGRIIHRLKS